ncbi:uncharacterized protein B0H18DRAFT_219876 [Fomitopsis serialis]|uniref:uncharacterized protein n=1 Tax=Fomitopsis serialis TaxID=139415 RepID=UPI002008C31A|nr:uncharacterized protein B0H18DRAFT_219876 [Neoantrodia serialis]KAH9929154.1 hypothetical protein B0H18DRAFT_219876 [Neoantrodia serialis]
MNESRPEDRRDTQQLWEPPSTHINTNWNSVEHSDHAPAASRRYRGVDERLGSADSRNLNRHRTELNPPAELQNVTRRRRQSSSNRGSDNIGGTTLAHRGTTPVARLQNAEEYHQRRERGGANGQGNENSMIRAQHASTRAAPPQTTETNRLRRERDRVCATKAPVGYLRRLPTFYQTFGTCTGNAEGQLLLYQYGPAREHDASWSSGYRSCCKQRFQNITCCRQDSL